MKISYIAFDSDGVKSMCTYIETRDVKICLDPGIAIETNSFPVPLVKRIALVAMYKERIKHACKKSDVVIITHYHYDHFTPDDISLYKGKILLIKDSRKNINKSQKKRAKDFLRSLRRYPKKVEKADGKSFKFGKTKIKFSKALWHGMEGTGLGFVVMVTIDDGKERLVFSSDLNGIYIKKYVDLIVKEKPDILITDGFPSYLLGYVVSFENLKKAIINNINLLKKTDAKLYIIDHHLLRDYRYKEIYCEVYKAAKELKKKVMTAAEVKGEKPMVIRGYEKYGATKWKKWEDMSWKRFKEIEKHAKIVAKKRK